ncbi:MAG: hypothetical protein ACXU8A_00150 [Burkholderiaceae bacterium]
MSAILGTFVNIKTMADGTPRIVLDLQCTLADVASMGMIPGTPFGIARITNEASVTPQPEVAEPKTKAGELCIMACNFCKDPEFWKWISATHYQCTLEETAKEFILEGCDVDSRKELDTDPIAAAHFHNEIRRPFLAWKSEPIQRAA